MRDVSPLPQCHPQTQRRPPREGGRPSPRALLTRPPTARRRTRHLPRQRTGLCSRSPGGLRGNGAPFSREQPYSAALSSPPLRDRTSPGPGSPEPPRAPMLGPPPHVGHCPHQGVTPASPRGEARGSPLAGAPAGKVNASPAAPRRPVPGEAFGGAGAPQTTARCPQQCSLSRSARSGGSRHGGLRACRAGVMSPPPPWSSFASPSSEPASAVTRPPGAGTNLPPNTCAPPVSPVTRTRVSSAGPAFSHACPRDRVAV